jgi:uncharacterized protein (DUF2147 family)
MNLRAAPPWLLAWGALLAVCADSAADPPMAADAIAGDWMVASQDAIIRFARNGDGYDGHIVWQLHDTYGPEDGAERNGRPVLDEHNPDAALRGKPLDGLRMLWGLRYQPDQGEWTGGHVYDLEDGNTYQCLIRLVDAGHLRLRGYFGITLLGGSTIWTRVRTLPAPEAALPGRNTVVPAGLPGPPQAAKPAGGP